MNVSTYIPLLYAGGTDSVENTMTNVVPISYIIIAASASATVLFGVVGYIAWMVCRRRKRTLVWKKTFNDDSSPESTLDRNVKISQSVPDLAAECGHSGDHRYNQARSIFKSIRQSTLPNVSQRHQNFQRQLSHKLDLSNIEFSVHSVKHKEQPTIGAIKPELYKQASVDSIKSEHALCGKLYYSLKYDTDAEVLIVCVIKAVDLPPKDFSGTSDPYVKIYLLPDRKNKLQTKVHRKTLTPEFNERFSFSIHHFQLTDRLLQFNIYDFDRFSRHDLIGTVLVRDIIQDCSKLNTEIFFTRDILSSQQEKFDLGELMLSLCYLPTAGRLTLTIVKARNLKAMDITGSSDPYVKVSLMCHSKRIKKKKTTVKRNTLNPVYNEAIVFDVPNINVEEVYLIIKVVDYDRIGSNEIMGCCAVGPKYVGTGKDHWYEMLESPRKPVAQWYMLHEAVQFYDDTTPNGKSCFRYRQATTESTCSDGSSVH